MWWFWPLAAPAALLALLSLGGERKRSEYASRRLAERTAYLPPASVIVPVKGADDGLRENLAALAALDYPDYELIVTAQTAADIPAGVLPRRAKVVLAHGGDPRASEKVQNLAAAVDAARMDTQIYAFADSDGRVTPGWLRALAAPLAEPGVGAATGYRWFTPGRPAFWSLLRAAWDAVVFGTLGPGDNPFAWGGAMAIRKQVFFQAGVPQRWKNAISDDYSLSAAVDAAGLTIAWAPGALVPCYEGTGAAQLFGWVRRQLRITRACQPRLWWAALAAHLLYCAGMTASVAAWIEGYRPAAGALAAQLIPGMWKGWRRSALAGAVAPECGRYRRAQVALVPLATWMWLAGLAASAFGSTIEWRGRRYELKTTSSPGAR
jgi:ceramide glucosyltransferase